MFSTLPLSVAMSILGLILPIEENQLEALPAPCNLVWLYLKRWEKLNKMEKK